MCFKLRCFIPCMLIGGLICWCSMLPTAFAATANPGSSPQVCHPPCCELVGKVKVPGARSYVRKYRCYPEPVGCYFSWLLRCVPIGGSGGQEAGGQSQGSCGSEIVTVYDVCIYHENYQNDWGCDWAVLEPCNSIIPHSPSVATQRNCHEQCLSTCPAAGLGCEFVWKFEGTL